MSEAGRPEVTLRTLHQDLGEVRNDLRGVKGLLTTGLRAFPPAWPREMLRTLHDGNQLLRENNRLSEERFVRLDVALREQAIRTQTVLTTVADSQRQLVEGQQQIVDSQRQLVESQREMIENQRLLSGDMRALSAEMRALIVRIDALIRGRGNGSPPESPAQ